MKILKSFGEIYSKNKKKIHLQYENMNQSFLIVIPIDLKIKLDVFNADSF